MWKGCEGQGGGQGWERGALRAGGANPWKALWAEWMLQEGGEG